MEMKGPFRCTNMQVKITVDGKTYVVGMVEGLDICFGYKSALTEDRYGSRIKKHSVGPRYGTFTIGRWFCADEGQEHLLLDLHKNEIEFTLQGNLCGDDGTAIPHTMISLTGCKSYKYRPRTGHAEDIIGEELDGEATSWVTDVQPSGPQPKTKSYGIDCVLWVPHASYGLDVILEGGEELLEGDYSGYELLWATQLPPEPSQQAIPESFTIDDASINVDNNRAYLTGRAGFQIGFMFYEFNLTTGEVLTNENRGFTEYPTMLALCQSVKGKYAVDCSHHPQGTGNGWVLVYKDGTLLQTIDTGATYQTPSGCYISWDGQYILVAYAVHDEEQDQWYAYVACYKGIPVTP